MRQRRSQQWILGAMVFGLIGSVASARSPMEERFAAVKALGAKPTPAGARLIDQIEGEMVLLDGQSSSLVTTGHGKIEYLLGRLAPDRSAYELKHLTQNPDGSVTQIRFRSGAPATPAMAVKSYYGEGGEIIVRQTLETNYDDRLRFVSDAYDFKSVGSKTLRLQKSHRESSYNLKIEGQNVRIDRIGQPSASFRLDREGDFIVQATPNGQDLDFVAFDHERNAFYRAQARLDDGKATFVVGDAKRVDLGAAQVHDLGLLAETKVIPGRSPLTEAHDLNGLNVDVDGANPTTTSH